MTIEKETIPLEISEGQAESNPPFLSSRLTRLLKELPEPGEYASLSVNSIKGATPGLITYIETVIEKSLGKPISHPQLRLFIMGVSVIGVPLFLFAKMHAPFAKTVVKEGLKVAKGITKRMGNTTGELVQAIANDYTGPVSDNLPQANPFSNSIKPPAY